jgi:hypothetical protein
VFRAEAVKKMNNFTAALQKTERFGLQPQMQSAAGLSADARDMLDTMPDVAADLGCLFRMMNEFLEGARQGADAAFDTWRYELCQQIEKQIGVSRALRGGPVWFVHVFLDPTTMKTSKGKAVDGENVTMVLAEPSLKFQQRIPIA